MRFLMILLFLGCSFFGQAQEIDVNGTVYKVKKDAIFKDGADVTETLSIDEKNEIKSRFANKIKLEKEEKARIAAVKKAEKDQKRAEKKQKSAEKALKKKEKAQSDFEKSGKKHKDAIDKYEKLKNKGKLSPEDEGKWLEKIEKLKEANEKAKKNL